MLKNPIKTGHIPYIPSCSIQRITTPLPLISHKDLLEIPNLCNYLQQQIHNGIKSEKKYTLDGVAAFRERLKNIQYFMIFVNESCERKEIKNVEEIRVVHIC